MKLSTIFFNMALLVFTSFVIITDGIPVTFLYILLTLMLLAVPVLNMTIILGSKEDIGWLDFPLKSKPTDRQINIFTMSSGKPLLKSTAIIFNILLLLVSCWAFLSQFPHPEEEGFIFYITLVFITPVLTSVAFIYFRQ
jgi:hypothetical protein